MCVTGFVKRERKQRFNIHSDFLILNRLNIAIQFHIVTMSISTLIGFFFLCAKVGHWPNKLSNDSSLNYGCYWHKINTFNYRGSKQLWGKYTLHTFQCFYLYRHIIKQSIIFYKLKNTWIIQELWNFRTAFKRMVVVPNLYFNMLPVIATHDSTIQSPG